MTGGDDWLNFCTRVHQRLAVDLCDVTSVRNVVQRLLPRNSFAESCFCKGCVLPIVDEVATSHLIVTKGAAKFDIHRALRCEGFDTPMYECGESHVGFSSYSRSNSYHPGDKSGRRAQSRRSPDFCIRYGGGLRMLGELKYVAKVGGSTTSQVVRELRDYLSIQQEPTSDWGHDFGFGLVYGFAGDGLRKAEALTDYWASDRIFISRFLPPDLTPRSPASSRASPRSLPDSRPPRCRRPSAR
jgi:hypothetical protein